MTNKDKYTKVFVDTFGITEEQAVSLKYQDIVEWDSVGHMDLISELEEAFDIAIGTEDIVNLNSYETGLEIIDKNYGINFDN